ncbi:unnamed protein product [marine sediment metagenome]|uniref:Uncharacterized protein n=1 Tax=marine sediment metagenome TaxID=412755 RepID=X0VAL8_9ZZZZ
MMSSDFWTLVVTCIFLFIVIVSSIILFIGLYLWNKILTGVKE